jgi:hypothetical protein
MPYSMPVFESSDSAFWAAFLGIPLAFGVSLAFLLKQSLVDYITLGIISQLLFLATNLDLFGKTRHYYLYRPNEFVDMYDEPSSRRWLGLSGPGL